jgi:putative FmdB family regulatory protein
MTYYDWICSDCEVIWEQEHPLGKAPKKTECPDCGELRSRNWSSVTTFRMKGDCHTNRVRLRDRYNKGMGKDEADEFLNASIKASEKSIETGWKHYSKITPKVSQELLNTGKVRRRSDKETKQAMENSKKMTETVYNGLDINIKDTLEQKPQ